jgi:hypothetical protein
MKKSIINWNLYVTSFTFYWRACTNPAKWAVISTFPLFLQSERSYRLSLCFSKVSGHIDFPSVSTTWVVISTFPLFLQSERSYRLSLCFYKVNGHIDFPSVSTKWAVISTFPLFLRFFMGFCSCISFYCTMYILDIFIFDIFSS